VWLVEIFDVDGRSYLGWAWFRARLQPSLLDFEQAATRYQEGSWMSIRRFKNAGRLPQVSDGLEGGSLQQRTVCGVDRGNECIQALFLPSRAIVTNSRNVVAPNVACRSTQQENQNTFE
jgi:hypothetical protein